MQRLQFKGIGPREIGTFTVYGRSPQEALESTKKLGSTLRERLPQTALVQTPRYLGFDDVEGRYVYELPVLLGDENAAARIVLQEATGAVY